MRRSTARSTGWCAAIPPRSSRDSTAPAMAFNLTVLSSLLGTPLEPDFTGVDLLIEEVSEQLYRIDRTMFHVTAQRQRPPARAGCGSAGSATSLPTTPNSPRDEAADCRGLVRPLRHRFGGRADIGHDARQPGRAVPERRKTDPGCLGHCKGRGVALYLEGEQQEGP